MARVKILLVTMFVISLFLMCGGCESEEHGRRDEWRDQQSERSDRDWDRESREERHEERHEDRH